jgi:tetratricopeptide (TPR) repeat protein
MADWEDYRKLGEKANEHRKRGQYREALECLSVVVQAFQNFARLAEERSNSLAIGLANWDSAVAYMMTGDVYLEMNQPHEALLQMLEGIKRFEIAAKHAGGKTKKELEEKLEAARQRFSKIANFERNMHEIVFKLAFMHPIAKDAALLYARRLMQLPMKNLETNEDHVREFKRACVDAYFQGEAPKAESDIEAFNLFIIENAEVIMRTGLDVVSNYNFHPFITN